MRTSILFLTICIFVTFACRKAKLPIVVDQSPAVYYFDGEIGGINNSAIPTSDNNLIIIGREDHYTYPPFALKISKQGDEIWRKIYYPKDYERIYASTIIETQSKNIFMCGSISKSPGYNYDVFLMKLNSTGDTIWSKVYMENDSETAFDMIQASDGNLVIAATGEPNSGSFWLGGVYYLYFLKTNTDGDTLWTAKHSLSNRIGARSIIETNNGEYLITYVNYDSEAPSTMMLKLDANGIKLWEQEVVQDNNYGGYSTTELSNGDLMFCGTYANDNRQIMVVKTDNLGNVIWEKVYGEYSGIHEEGYSMKENPDGTFTITGYAKNSNDRYEDDVFLLKIDGDGFEISYKVFDMRGDYSGYNLVVDDNGDNTIIGLHTDSIRNRSIFMMKTDKNGKFIP